MIITTTKLTRAAGLCAVAAGLLFIFVQFIHPDENVASVTTTAWKVTHALTLTMSVLALIGVSGMYLRQVRETGLLGLIGFLLFGSSFVVIATFTFAETVVLPQLADAAPQYVSDFLATVIGGDVTGEVGALTAANGVAAVTYLLGGLVFGVALFRAGIVARWAALLLAVGALAAVLVPLLPHSLDRIAAFPVGLALAGLGYSLWRERRATASEPVVSVRSSQLDPAGA
jgi:predicted aconitase with swiveling domain